MEMRREIGMKGAEKREWSLRLKALKEYLDNLPHRLRRPVN